ncbi:MAG: NDP-sugar synthase [Candidatus Pelagibacter sp.]
MIQRTAVILCGGSGRRLGQLGKKIPKSLVKIHQKPIIWFILKSLKKNKFNHFILPIGYKGNQIKRYIRQNSEFSNYEIELIDTGKKTSIAKRIFKIKKFIKSENFLILNGDSIFDTNLSQIFNTHIKKRYDISFISCEAEADFGTIGTMNGKVINFRRNLNFGSVLTDKKHYLGYVYSGMAVINKKILSENFKDSINFEKDFYPKVIKKYKSSIKKLKGFWCAMDNVKDIDSLNKKNNNFKSYKKIKKILKKLK